MTPIAKVNPMDARTLRARSRQLHKDNDYAKKFQQLVGTNLVGPQGFRFESRVVMEDGTTPDTLARTAIESAWDRWGKRGSCEVSGRLSLRELCLLLVKSAARDGEYLARWVRGSQAGNPFGLALQVLEPRLEHAPLGAVDHHRHLGDVRLGRDQVQERAHGMDGVQQALVHVDVDDLRAGVHLLARDAQGLGIVPLGHQLAEGLHHVGRTQRAGHRLVERRDDRRRRVRAFGGGSRPGLR